MQSLARELNISKFVIRKKMAQDFRFKSYALRRGQFMSQATKERRLEKAKLLFYKLKKTAANRQFIFFLDENNSLRTKKLIRKIIGGCALTLARCLL
jgi:hypothetical protein